VTKSVFMKTLDLGKVYCCGNTFILFYMITCTAMFAQHLIAENLVSIPWLLVHLKQLKRQTGPRRRWMVLTFTLVVAPWRLNGERYAATLIIIYRL